MLAFGHRDGGEHRSCASVVPRAVPRRDGGRATRGAPGRGWLLATHGAPGRDCLLVGKGSRAAEQVRLAPPGEERARGWSLRGAADCGRGSGWERGQGSASRRRALGAHRRCGAPRMGAAVGRPVQTRVPRRRADSRSRVFQQVYIADYLLTRFQRFSSFARRPAPTASCGGCIRLVWGVRSTEGSHGDRRGARPAARLSGGRKCPW